MRDNPVSLIQRFSLNRVGRDFVVGDIHGRFDILHRMLKLIGFDTQCDRLFCLGDLVDRGAWSHEVLRWLAYPWLHSILANHEQMAIGISEGRHEASNYLANGGAWFLRLQPEEQKAIAAVFRTLPLAIEIETPYGTVGMVHAEVPTYCWPELTAMLDHPEQLSKGKLKRLMAHLLWSRSRIDDPDPTKRGYRDPATWDRNYVSGIHRVYVGHSPMPEPTSVGNIIYIDTGLGKGGSLTCINLAEPDTYYILSETLP